MDAVAVTTHGTAGGEPGGNAELAGRGRRGAHGRCQTEHYRMELADIAAARARIGKLRYGVPGLRRAHSSAPAGVPHGQALHADAGKQEHMFGAPGGRR
ncbi:hypothetical protein ACU4GD_16755 [Cupriavidus basilensis]